MKTTARTVLQLGALTTVAWAVSVLIEPDPPGVNIFRFSLKWFVYTYAMAATVFVLIPFVTIFSVAALIYRFSFKPAERKYRTAYWLAFGAAVIWAVFLNYGNYYALCRTHHSASYCDGNTYKSN